MTLREKLIVLRDKAGISQMTLAHQLGVSRQAVSRWRRSTAYRWIGCAVMLPMLARWYRKRT